MFTLAEIKELEKNYIYNDNTKQLHLRLDSSAKKTQDLSHEEKNRIISALFLARVLNESTSAYNPIQKTRYEEDILKKVQFDFEQRVLTPEKKIANSRSSPLMLGRGKEINEIMFLLASPKETTNYMPEIYMQYVLNENGKKATNIHRETIIEDINEDDSSIYSIQYDIENLDKRNDFQKSLDVNNPQWNQSVQKVELSPKQTINRRKFVEKYIKYYDMVESSHDAMYQERKENENKLMQQVAHMVNNHEPISPIYCIEDLFYLLKAAQNLTLDCGYDFLEKLLSQPSVNNALLSFKSSYAKNFKLMALKNKKNGLKHRLTPGERDRKAANECLANSYFPTRLLSLAETLGGLRGIPFDSTDINSLTRKEKSLVSLVCVTMRQNEIQFGNIILEDRVISFEEQENGNTLTN